MYNYGVITLRLKVLYQNNVNLLLLFTQRTSSYCKSSIKVVDLTINLFSARSFRLVLLAVSFVNMYV